MALDTFPLLIFRHFSKSFLWEWLPDKFDLTTVYFMRRLAIISLGFFIFGSSSHLASMQGDRRNSEYAFDEMRIELSDVKHALNNSKVEFEILEEFTAGMARQKERLLSFVYQKFGAAVFRPGFGIVPHVKRTFLPIRYRMYAVRVDPLLH